MTADSVFRDLVAFSIQIGLVVLAVALLVKVARVPARARYLGLRIALAVSLAVPWLLRAPAIERSAAATVVTRALPAPPRATGEPDAATVVTTAPLTTPEPPSPLPWSKIAVTTLIVGVSARILWLTMGVLRLLRLKGQGVVVDAPEYAELQRELGTTATIAQVKGLAQPATFGIRRPIVLLPDALASAPASLRRAVVTHELFHVRRRDWLSVLGEEMVRTALWFHPAVLWLTSHLQLAREQIVDELTVQATGDRRTYVEALLAFADTPGLSPAPAFAHRRQLFHRILSVSKERVMSRPRIVTSTAALVSVVLGASWYASTVFPIVVAAKVEMPPSPSLLMAPPTSAVSSVPPEKEPGQSGNVPPDQPAGEAVAVRAVTPENPIPRRTRGASPAWPPQFASVPTVVSALVTLDRNGMVTSVTRDACSVSGRQNNENATCSAFFDAVASAIRQWRYDRPAQGPMQFYVKVTYRPGIDATITQSGESWASSLRELQDSLRVLADQARRGDDRVATDDFLRAELAVPSAQFRELERAQRLAIERGSPNPDMVRIQQEMARLNDEMGRVEERLRNGDSPLRAEQARALAEQLRDAQRQLEATRARQTVDEQARAEEQRRALAEQLREVEQRLLEARARLKQTGTATVNPTPPTPLEGSQQLKSPSGRAPLRVAPPMPTPVVVKRVNPQYSPEAMQARIEGTVAVEVLVDEQGHVADARVLTSIPLLDKSALDAARQWEFTPTLLNGQPVPVLLMLEMHFTLK